MYKDKLKKTAENIYELPKIEGMLVPGEIFVSDKLFKNVEETCVKQLANIASLPGIIKKAIAMSDVHVGYGFPIGGVAAFNLEKGIISPGGVGYDINCGVRLLLTNLTKLEFMKKRSEILNEISKAIPAGTGRSSEFNLSESEIRKVLDQGLGWTYDKGYATKEDLERTEDNGCIKGSDSSKVSKKAKARGKDQLGTLGSGNHFLEIQEVEEIFDEKTAKAFGIKNKDQIVVMIHCGSRGLGHQTASDYIQAMGNEYGFSNLPDRELIFAPINSKLGKDYRAAMNAAANFAFVNRQIITYQIRKSFQKYFPKVKLDLLYDVAHNIAKFEEFEIEGKKQTLCVHRKGATRSFGPNRPEIPSIYRKIGQPIILPGSMGTFSYVLVGTDKARALSFASTAHGAGRVLSRSYAIKNLSYEKINRELESKGVLLKANSKKGAVEEAPEAYKDVNEVVRVSDELGIGKIVARLKPLAVLKG